MMMMSTVELSKWGFQFNQYESLAQLLPSLLATSFYQMLLPDGLVSLISNTMVATCRTGTVYPCRSSKFTLVFVGFVLLNL
jgi:hypothetical protein